MTAMNWTQVLLVITWVLIAYNMLHSLRLNRRIVKDNIELVEENFELAMENGMLQIALAEARRECE